MIRHTYLASIFVAFLGLFSLPVTAAQSDVSPVAATVQEVQVSLIDLNNADVNTLQKELAGIGKTKAEAIVAYRTEHGPFASVDELLEIKGIGKALLERNRDKLTVN